LPPDSLEELALSSLKGKAKRKLEAQWSSTDIPLGWKTRAMGKPSPDNSLSTTALERKEPSKSRIRIGHLCGRTENWRQVPEILPQGRSFSNLEAPKWEPGLFCPR
jgi:hypothetical protein